MRHASQAYTLGEFINSVHQIPFAYGVHDCGIFAAGCIKALTGVEVFPNVKYTSAKQLLKELKRAFGTTHLDEVAAQLAKQHGWTEVAPTFAHRGDLVVIGANTKARLGIVSLHGTHIMTPGDTGLLYERFDRFTTDIKAYHISSTQSSEASQQVPVNRPLSLPQVFTRIPEITTDAPRSTVPQVPKTFSSDVTADIDAYKRANKKTVNTLEEALADLRRRGLE